MGSFHTLQISGRLPGEVGQDQPGSSRIKEPITMKGPSSVQMLINGPAAWGLGYGPQWHLCCVVQTKHETPTSILHAGSPISILTAIVLSLAVKSHKSKREV